MENDIKEIEKVTKVKINSPELKEIASNISQEARYLLGLHGSYVEIKYKNSNAIERIPAHRFVEKAIQYAKDSGDESLLDKVFDLGLDEILNKTELKRDYSDYRNKTHKNKGGRPKESSLIERRLYYWAKIQEHRNQGLTLALAIEAVALEIKCTPDYLEGQYKAQQKENLKVKTLKEKKAKEANRYMKIGNSSFISDKGIAEFVNDELETSSDIALAVKNVSKKIKQDEKVCLNAYKKYFVKGDNLTS